jgi:molybdate transport system substrate-binding protein
VARTTTVIRHVAPALLLAGSLLMTPSTGLAQVKVLMSGGFSGPYEQLVPEFVRTTGIAVTTGSGASQGAGPQTIAAQLARGVAADVVILSREGLAELVTAGRIAAGTDVDLARVPLGVAVRAGAPHPDVRTVAALRDALLDARIVAVPASTSGIFLMKEVFPHLGVSERIDVRATPRGAGATALVASGEARLAVMPVSEIVHAPGVELAGVIADEVQLLQVFAAAIVAGSGEQDAAKRLIAFLASEQSAPAIRASGMQALGEHRAR